MWMVGASIRLQQDYTFSSTGQHTVKFNLSTDSLYPRYPTSDYGNFYQRLTIIKVQLSKKYYTAESGISRM